VHAYFAAFYVINIRALVMNNNLWLCALWYLHLSLVL
jgi:hypothetical protein